MFNPNNPFEEEVVDQPAQPDMRAQLLASLQQRMAPVAAPDTSAEEIAAQRAQIQSDIARAGTQLGQAFIGKSVDGSNIMSDSLDRDSKASLGKVMESKRMAAEADKRREELRNQLSTRFVDDENLRVRTAEANKVKDGEYDRSRKDHVADQEALFKQQKELAAMNKRDSQAAKTEEKQHRADETAQQKLSKDLASPQALDTAVQDVEGVLGAPLTSFSRKGNKLFRDGEEVDLPGAEVPLVGNVSFYNDRARALNAASSAVFNMVLKDRSGAAVTDAELARLKTEFNDGKYTTEADKIDALQRFQRRVKEVMGNREAGYNEDVVNEYKNRGGRVSEGVNAVPRETFKAPPIPPKGPSAGHEEDGFVFMGGDPKDQANWKKK